METKGDLASRFWGRIRKPDGVAGCWLWIGKVSDKGYGYLRGKRVHRIAYEELVGPIKDGLQLDHLCRVRNCCNPSHLEQVTARENFLRGDAQGAVSTRTDRCRRGHDLSMVGYVRPDGRGRECRSCRELREGRAARRKESAA